MRMLYRIGDILRVTLGNLMDAMQNVSKLEGENGATSKRLESVMKSLTSCGDIAAEANAVPNATSEAKQQWTKLWGNELNAMGEQAYVVPVSGKDNSCAVRCLILNALDHDALAEGSTTEKRSSRISRLECTDTQVQQFRYALAADVLRAPPLPEEVEITTYNKGKVSQRIVQQGLMVGIEAIRQYALSRRITIEIVSIYRDSPDPYTTVGDIDSKHVTYLLYDDNHYTIVDARTSEDCDEFSTIINKTDVETVKAVRLTILQACAALSK